MIRILKIQGKSGPEREARLMEINRWMEKSGWSLVDYDENLGSVMFERKKESEMSGFDPTRWLPSPEWLNPYQHIKHKLSQLPRQFIFYLKELSLRSILITGISILLTMVFIFLLSQYRSDTILLDRGDIWLYVSANTLNVRELPNMEGKIVAVLYKNQSVLIGKTVDGWIEVVQPERGYVARKYLSELPQ